MGIIFLVKISVAFVNMVSVVFGQTPSLPFELTMYLIAVLLQLVELPIQLSVSAVGPMSMRRTLSGGGKGSKYLSNTLHVLDKEVMS